MCPGGSRLSSELSFALRRLGRVGMSPSGSRVEPDPRGVLRGTRGHRGLTGGLGDPVVPARSAPGRPACAGCGGECRFGRHSAAVRGGRVASRSRRTQSTLLPRRVSPGARSGAAWETGAAARGSPARRASSGRRSRRQSCRRHRRLRPLRRRPRQGRGGGSVRRGPQLVDYGLALRRRAGDGARLIRFSDASVQPLPPGLGVGRLGASCAPAGGPLRECAERRHP